MKRKILSLVLAAALSVFALAGCGAADESTADSSSEEESSESETESDETEDTETGEASSEASSESVSEEETQSQDYGTLYVSFPTGNIRMAMDILALEKGYFEEEGVTVEPLNITGQDALTAINNGGGQLDLLTVGFVADLQAIGSGYDLQIIAGTAVEGGAIIAKEGSASAYQDDDTILNTEAVLSAQLGLVRNEAAWVITRQYLLDSGVSEEDIEAIEDESSGNISYYQDQLEVAQAISKGEIDLGFLPMEYALLYADSYGLELVTEAGDLQENYVCCRVVTSSAVIESKYDALVAYLKAKIRAFEYYKQGETDESIREDIVNTVAAYSGKEVDYVETYLYDGVTVYDTDPNTAGVISYVEAAVNSGLLDSSATDFSTYDITQNIDVSVYEQAINDLVQTYADDSFFAELLEQFEADNAAA